MWLQSNAECVEDSGPHCGVAICDDEQLTDSSDDESFYSSSEESIHSIEAPPYSPVQMNGSDSGDDDLDIDILLPVTNEPCKN